MRPVLAQYKPKRRHQEFLGFLGHIEASAPGHLDVHLICDNCGSHEHARMKAWLAHCNQQPKPFTWTANAESILAEIERLCKIVKGMQR